MKIVIILLIVVSSLNATKEPPESIFAKALGEKSVANWVNFQSFGGFAGVPEELFAIKDFSAGVRKARALLDQKSPIHSSVIVAEITRGINNDNYSPLFGWYLACLGKKQGKDLAIWLPTLLDDDKEILNKTIVFLVKKLFEQEITINGENKKFLNDLVAQFRKSQVKVMPSALVENSVEKELKHIASELSGN